MTFKPNSTFPNSYFEQIVQTFLRLPEVIFNASAALFSFLFGLLSIISYPSVAWHPYSTVNSLQTFSFIFELKIWYPKERISQKCCFLETWMQMNLFKVFHCSYMLAFLLPIPLWPIVKVMKNLSSCILVCRKNDLATKTLFECIHWSKKCILSDKILIMLFVKIVYLIKRIVFKIFSINSSWLPIQVNRIRNEVKKLVIANKSMVLSLQFLFFFKA